MYCRIRTNLFFPMSTPGPNVESVFVRQGAQQVTKTCMQIHIKLDIPQSFLTCVFNFQLCSPPLAPPPSSHSAHGLYIVTMSQIIKVPLQGKFQNKTKQPSIKRVTFELFCSLGHSVNSFTDVTIIMALYGEIHFGQNDWQQYLQQQLGTIGRKAECCYSVQFYNTFTETPRPLSQCMNLQSS